MVRCLFLSLEPLLSYLDTILSWHKRIDWICVFPHTKTSATFLAPTPRLAFTYSITSTFCFKVSSSFYSWLRTWKIFTQLHPRLRRNATWPTVYFLELYYVDCINVDADSASCKDVYFSYLRPVNSSEGTQNWTQL